MTSAGFIDITPLMGGERQGATIKDEVITFPAGSQPEVIKGTLCKDCRFSPHCTGPRDVAGKVQAENKNIADFYNDSYIIKLAKCLKSEMDTP